MSTPAPAGPARRRGAPALLAAGLAALLATTLAAVPVALPARLAAQGAPPTADVVVDYDDGRVAVRRVALDGAGLTGLSVLERADLQLVQNGGAVCALGGVGCPAGNCFCDPLRYWANHHATPGGGWAFAEVGAAQHPVRAGDVEGWVWGGTRPPVSATAATRAVLLGYDWLRSRQLADGSQGDHAGLTAEHVLAARSAGSPPNAAAGGRGPLDYLRREAGNYSALGAAQAGKLAAAVAAAGEDPRSFGGVDLAARIAARRNESGTYGSGGTWDTAWALIGLAAAGEPVPAAGLTGLVAAASPAGGWGFGAAASEPDPDSTGLALQALSAGGLPVSHTAVTAALDWLDAGQGADGGWGHEPDAPSNANSTAYALQGLLAVGEDPRAPRWTTPSGADPLAFLLGEQRPDGHFAFDSSPADLVGTLQVVPAIAGRPAPAPSRAVANRRALAWLAGQRTPEGGYAGFNPGATLDAVLALAALGQDPDAPAPSGARPSAYLAGLAASYAAQGAGANGKLVAGVVALGHDPRAFGGRDLVAALAAQRNVTGTYGSGGTWDTAWALIGLAAAGEPVPEAAVTGLAAAASPRGGWGFAARADAPDVGSTGLALQALAAASEPRPAAVADAVTVALHWLRRQQLAGGAFPGYGGTPNANDTGLALGGLVAWGQDPAGPGWMNAAGRSLPRRTPIEGLLALQSPRGGYAGYAGPDDPAATTAALLGLSFKALPLVPPRFDGRTLFLPLVGGRW
jgi:hypothetical protein